MNAGLYIHIPFCSKRCGYCDFYTVAGQTDRIPAYLQALQTEMLLYRDHPEIASLTFDTLYLGGGTPSLLSAGQLAALISAAHDHFHFKKGTEITVETNPGTVDADKLAAFRRAGINRLSIGMQSLRAPELHFLERNHSAQDTVTCFRDARAAGFDNISIDLIFALPKQKLADWRQTLQTAAELAPEHISAYNLTFEDGTPLTRQLRQGQIRACGEESQRRMQLAAMEILQRAGFLHYEISNYAKPECESRHNRKYWDGSPYLGLGASAHSYIAGRRFWNGRNFKEYGAIIAGGRAPVAGEEILQPDDRAFENLFLGLRQRAGVNLRQFEHRTGVPFFEKYAPVLSRFFSARFDHSLTAELTAGIRSLKSKLLQIEDGFLRLTDRGVLLCDAICAEFIS